MADPLSIAAGVAGLLSLSATAYGALSAFLADTKNAPKAAHDILLEVSEMRLALMSTSDILTTFHAIPRVRKKMVQLQHLILVLTQTFDTFSDLRTLLARFSHIPQSLWTRIKWAWLQSRTNDMVKRLRSHKASISLVLNILQCESDLEAENSRAALNQIMQKICTDNNTIRLQLLQADSVAVNDTWPLSSTDDEITPRRVVGEATKASDVRCDGACTRPSESHQASIPGGRSFEDVLAQTWVYSRTRDNATDMSFSTGLFDSRSWGVISGLSLGEISHISVIRLPVSTDAMEEATSGWYWESKVTHLPPTWDRTPQKDSSAPWARATVTLPRRYTIALVGDGGVGKSSMASQLCFGSIVPHALDFTIQDSYNLDITVDGRKSPCQVIDTSGQEGYEVLLQDAIEDADGVIVVFSLDSVQSFHRAKSLLDIVKAAKRPLTAVGAASPSSGNTNPLPMALVGNKLDLNLRWHVSRFDATRAAKTAGCAFFECSALAGKGVSDPFCEVIRIAGKDRTSRGYA